MDSLLVLGCGYTGQVVAHKAHERGLRVFETSRKGPLKFDLQNRGTWTHLPQTDSILWTFPAEPLSLVQEFLKTTKAHIVAVGTTGSYATTIDDEVITEDSPLDMSEARVQGEECIRNHGGAIVRSAGIYGPGRNPLRWVQSGLVGRSQKLVNFIHVDDLAEILLAALEAGLKGVNLLAADGRPERWGHLIDRWQREFSLAVPEDAPPSMRPSKSVDSTWTLKRLKVKLRYEDVFSGVRSLVESPPTDV